MSTFLAENWYGLLIAALLIIALAVRAVHMHKFYEAQGRPQNEGRRAEMVKDFLFRSLPADNTTKEPVHSFSITPIMLDNGMEE